MDWFFNFCAGVTYLISFFLGYFSCDGMFHNFENYRFVRDYFLPRNRGLDGRRGEESNETIRSSKTD